MGFSLQKDPFYWYLRLDRPSTVYKVVVTYVSTPVAAGSKRVSTKKQKVDLQIDVQQTYLSCLSYLSYLSRHDYVYDIVNIRVYTYTGRTHPLCVYSLCNEQEFGCLLYDV